MTGAKVLVTGSAGHLGEALARGLRAEGHEVTGLDILPSPYTDVVGSVSDRAVVRECLSGTGAVLHAATLHKPHVGSHGKQAFVDTNVTGTLTLLEEAVAAGTGRFVFTSTTSSFGRALTPASGSSPSSGPRPWRPAPHRPEQLSSSGARRRPGVMWPGGAPDFVRLNDLFYEPAARCWAELMTAWHAAAWRPAPRTGWLPKAAADSSPLITSARRSRTCSSADRARSVAR